MASEKLFKPSTEAIRISLTPLFLVSFIMESQNLLLSASPIHIPRISFWPFKSIQIAIYTAFFTTIPSYGIMDCIHKHYRVYALKLRICHSLISGKILSVILDISVGENAV